MVNSSMGLRGHINRILGITQLAYRVELAAVQQQRSSSVALQLKYNTSTPKLVTGDDELSKQNCVAQYLFMVMGRRWVREPWVIVGLGGFWVGGADWRGREREDY
ncbi:unnamed protein product [Ilex paraguariensis]|uniref:Uncharacterized protein n=1 Tax=Ilex paraguariensis TaxID=185542 RepID=A0ABC8RAB0_9AQUA